MPSGYTAAVADGTITDLKHKIDMQCTVTKTYSAEIENDEVMRLLCIAIGAPEDAYVELSEYGVTIVTWKVVE